jgi:hypothetical protein
LCSRWRSTASRWYIDVARDACSQRRRTRQTCLVLSSQVSGQPVIGYLPRGLSPARDQSGSARPGCRTDSAIAYDRKRAKPRRNGRGAKGIARSHSCIVGTAGCRSNPTAVRRGTLRREIIRRFEAPPRSDERRPWGRWSKTKLPRCEWASRQRRSVWQRSISNLYAPSRSPESLRSLDSPIGSENGSSESAPGSTCSISNSGRGPRAMIGFAQSSIGSPSSPQ